MVRWSVVCHRTPGSHATASTRPVTPESYLHFGRSAATPTRSDFQHEPEQSTKARFPRPTGLLRAPMRRCSRRPEVNRARMLAHEPQPATSGFRRTVHGNQPRPKHPFAEPAWHTCSPRLSSVRATSAAPSIRFPVRSSSPSPLVASSPCDSPTAFDSVGRSPRASTDGNPRGCNCRGSLATR